VTVFSHSAYTLAVPRGDAAAVSALRRAEDERFFARTTAGPPLWLGQLDAPLRHPGIDVFEAPLASVEVAAVRRALATVLPPVCTLLAPLALGAHVDHRLVHAAACLLRSSTRELIFYYEDLPYAGFMPLDAIEAAAHAAGQRIDAELEPQWWESAALREAKAWAVACYGSQCDDGTLAALLGHGRRLGAGAALPAERVWRVR